MDNKATYCKYLNDLKNSHQYQGLSNDCGPFSISIVLNTLRKSQVYGQSLANSTTGIIWKGILPTLYRFPNGATFPWSVVQIFKQYNLKGMWSILSTRKSIHHHLNDDCIVILLIGRLIPLWAHYVILAAHLPQRGFGFIDPGNPKKDLVWLTDKKLLKFWKSYAYSKIVIYPHKEIK